MWHSFPDDNDQVMWLALFIYLSVGKITAKDRDGFGWNFPERLDFTQSTVNQILGENGAAKNNE